MWDSSTISPQQLVFGKVFQALIDLVEGFHPIEAAESWVSEVQDMVKKIKVNLVKAEAW